MSEYIIEVSGNQPYYVEVSGSTDNTIYNLEVIQTSGTYVEINSDYRSLLLSDIPSGYNINLTSGLLPVNRISGLSVYVVSLAGLIASDLINTIDGGTP
jgi:hypothetical protein